MKSLATSVVIAAITALAAIAPAAAQQPQKVAADKSYIRFVVRQMNAPMEGRFRKFDGSVAFDPVHPEATKAEFEVELGSIDLGSEEGETEARRKPWLNVEAFPKAKFTATAVKSLGGNKYEAHGNLTIKGTTLPIVAAFTLSDAGGTRTVEGEFPLKRLQYKIGEGPWSDTDTVADEITVRFRFALSSNR
jgi:polyisoprenoid-binding protein YceI